MYGHRYRHPVVHSTFMWGASTVFLSLTSSIISSFLDRSTEPKCDGMLPLFGKQNPDVQNMWTLLLWIMLILTIKCNADVAMATVAAAVASPDGSNVHINGQRIRAPVEVIAQYAWAAFLIRGSVSHWWDGWAVST
ncbi:unnamed protein product [Miscanthus lutarioriparius]|uniref:Uncharacterized protein n=1 Tax=Miscanthus lutarioriparius TaxID=422564 RepID=A0A811P2W7_9POAL|nr:unnamed protein product [Miscanthus lutarioriparius]